MSESVLRKPAFMKARDVRALDSFLRWLDHCQFKVDPAWRDGDVIRVKLPRRYRKEPA